MSQDKELDALLEELETLIAPLACVSLNTSVTDLLDPLVKIAYIKGYIQAHKDLQALRPPFPDLPPF